MTETNGQGPTYWVGSPPTRCDACGDAVHGVFSDCRSPLGAWGVFCGPCVRDLGLEYGVGRGQRYERQPDGRWLKTKG